MAKERVDFGGLRGQALALHLDIVQLRQDCIALKSEAAGAGNAGARSFKDFAGESKTANVALTGVTANLVKQATLHKLLKLAVKETAKGFHELVEGAIAFRAAKESAFDPNSFNNLLSALKGGLATALGQGGDQLFASIKTLLDALGAFVRSETFVHAIQIIDDGLAAAAGSAQQLVLNLQKDQVLEIATAIGNIARILSAVIGPVLQGVIAGVSELSAMLNFLVGVGRRIFGDDFAIALELIGHIIVGLGTLKLVSIAIAATFSGMGIPILIILAAMLGISGAAEVFKDKSEQTVPAFETIAKLCGVTVVAAFDKAKDAAIAFLNTLKSAVKAAAQAIKGLLLQGEIPQGTGLGFLAETAGHVRKLNEGLDRTESAAKAAKDIILDGSGSDRGFFKSIQDGFSVVSDGFRNMTGSIKEQIPELRGIFSQEKEAISLPIEVQPVLRGSQGGGGAAGTIGDQIYADMKKGLDLLAPVVRGFGEILSSTIADALDPDRPGKQSIARRFKEFFKSIPLMLLQAFAGQGGRVGGGIGLASGGEVPGRPAGLAASDTVNAWLTPGEWVMRLAAVRKYGAAFMALVNSGQLNPSLVQALTGLNSARAPRARSGGYAHGGPVTEGAAAVAPVQALPVLVADERQARAIFSAGGGSAFLEILAKHRAEVKTIIG